MLPAPCQSLTKESENTYKTKLLTKDMFMKIKVNIGFLKLLIKYSFPTSHMWPLKLCFFTGQGIVLDAGNIQEKETVGAPEGSSSPSWKSTSVL